MHRAMLRYHGERGHTFDKAGFISDLKEQSIDQEAYMVGRSLKQQRNMPITRNEAVVHSRAYVRSDFKKVRAK